MSVSAEQPHALPVVVTGGAHFIGETKAEEVQKQRPLERFSNSKPGLLHLGCRNARRNATGHWWVREKSIRA